MIHIRFVTAAVLILSSVVISCSALPVNRKAGGDSLSKQDHNIDKANEVHHDTFVKDSQKLMFDALPDLDQKINLDKEIQIQPADNGNPDEDDEREGAVEDIEDDDPDMNIDEKLAKRLKKMNIDQLIPADHMDVVKMEQDGHMNKEYHKEMFLGGQHDEFKSDTVEGAEDKLKEIVARADTDGDGELSLGEMEDWILEKMKDHFREAVKENDHIFEHLDPDGDGSIKWKEYYVHFLLSRGFDLENSLAHIVDYGDSVQMDQDDKNALISYKFRWHDADDDPKDNKLTKDEFMSFRHPEHSQRSLDTMARNLLRSVDNNDDDMITEEEFSALPPGEVENKEYEEMDRKWQEERKQEFRTTMDKNHDKSVDMSELRAYLDPTNPIQAKLEAQSLMSMMDDNGDGTLTMGEIMKHSDIFISSKLVNFAANVHDEF